jgi:hypothetical protein
MTLRNYLRWTLGAVGFVGLAIVSVGYYINLVVALTYFPNQDWSRFAAADVLFALGALYLILVAISGRWKFWAGR